MAKRMYVSVLPMRLAGLRVIDERSALLGALDVVAGLCWQGTRTVMYVPRWLLV